MAMSGIAHRFAKLRLHKDNEVQYAGRNQHGVVGANEAGATKAAYKYDFQGSSSFLYEFPRHCAGNAI